MNAQRSLEEKFHETGGKRPYVQRLFARIARVYDPLNRLMSFGLDRHWRAFAARLWWLLRTSVLKMSDVALHSACSPSSSMHR
jgi:ubiquinone/menaquinone biosynthesis C-methylase UbiE